MTQCERVLEYMEEFGSITPLQAMRDLGVYRLGARIFDLKEKGYPIESRLQAVPNRYGKKSYIKKYSIAKGARG